MKHQPIILALLLSALSIPAAAQSDDSFNESVVVQGSFRPVLTKHKKINFPAVITDTIARIDHTFRYSVEPTRLKALYEPSRIKAARIVGEPATRLYNNYIRLGFGTYYSPMADLYWSSTRDRLKTYGFRLNHRSSWAGITHYGRNHFALTDVTLFGKLIVKERYQLSSSLSYEHDHNYYYGFHDSLLTNLGLHRSDLAMADYRAKYNLATWNVGICNLELDVNRLGYAANARLSEFWASYGQRQFNLNLSGDVHYGFPLLRQYKGVAFLRAEWDAYYNTIATDEQPLLSATSADTARAYRNLLKLNPYVDFLFRGFQFHAGFTAGGDAYTSSTTFRFFPDVVVSKDFLNGNLVVSAAATGGFSANSWNTIRQLNPYIAPNAELRATRHYDFYAHLRWNPSKKIEVNAELAYALLRDDLNFRLDTASYRLQNVFQANYVDNNRLSVGADVSFVNDEMLTLRAGAHYYHYTLTADNADDTVLCYRPDFDAMVGGVVNYHDRWLFGLEVQLLGAMDGDLGDRLPLRYGINAEVEYRHNRALSFFAKLDNIAFQRYYYYSHYPSQRGLFIIGLTYTIPHK